VGASLEEGLEGCENSRGCDETVGLGGCDGGSMMLEMAGDALARFRDRGGVMLGCGGLNGLCDG
jgi:hypothetical protein